MPEFKRYLRTLARNPVIRVFALFLFVALMGGIAVAFLEERAGHQDFHSISEALWWAVVTMTTVGYGDSTPQSGGSRILAVAIMFTGISLISFLTGSIASVAVARRLRSNQGLTAIKVKDHIIICGWHHKIGSVLDAFLKVADHPPDQLVLINEEPEDAMLALKNQYAYIHRPGVSRSLIQLLTTESEHYFRQIAILQDVIGKTFNELFQHYREHRGWILSIPLPGGRFLSRLARRRFSRPLAQYCSLKGIVPRIDWGFRKDEQPASLIGSSSEAVFK